MDNLLGLPPVCRITGGPFQGGMGCVYQVHHREWDALLALKQPLSSTLTDPRVRERFLQECELWVRLGLHEHIVLCHYVRSLNGVPTVFAEWMDGGDLQQRMASGVLYAGLDHSPEQVQLRILDTAIQIARGMGYAHSKGLIHRDLKPGNVMFTAAGTAKISDFGLAALRQGGKDAAVGFGTLAYASPEQQDGAPSAPAMDLWSFGVLLLELFLGERLWNNCVYVPAALEDYLSRCRVPVPGELRGLLRQCCRVKPLERPRDFETVEQTLLACYRRIAGREYPRPNAGATALSADSWNNRALSYLDLGKPAEAEESWTKALRAQPGHMAALYNQTLYRWRRAQIDDVTALGILQTAYNSAPRRSSAELLARFFVERRSAEPIRQLNRLYDQSLVELGVLEREDRRGLLLSKRVNQIAACGQTALLVCADGTAELWNLAQRRPVSWFPLEGRRVHGAALNGDGTAVLACDEGILCWSGGRQRWIPVPEGTVRHIVFCAQPGTILLHASRPFEAGTKEYCIRLRLEDGARSLKIRFRNLSPEVFVSLKGGREVLLCDEKRLLRVDLDRARLVQVYSGASAALRCAAVSEDGQFAAACAGTERLYSQVKCASWTRDFAVNQDKISQESCRISRNFNAEWRQKSRPAGVRQLVNTASEVLVWRLEDGALLRTLPAGACTALAFVSAGLLSAGTDGVVRLWELAFPIGKAATPAADPAGRCLRSFPAHRGPVRALAAPNGNSYLSAGAEGVYLQGIPAFGARACWQLCRAESAQRLRAEEARFEGLLKEAAERWKQGEVSNALSRLYEARMVPGYSRNSAYLRLNAAMGRGNRVKGLLGAWKRRTVEPDKETAAGRGTASDHENATTALGKGGAWTLQARFDGSLRITRTEDGTLVRSLRSSVRDVSAAALSADGHFAALGCLDGRVCVLRPDTGEILWQQAHTSGMVTALAFAPVGCCLLSGRGDGAILVHALQTGRILQVLVGHRSAVRALRYSPDGLMARSDAEDRTTVIWQFDYEYSPE